MKTIWGSKTPVSPVIPWRPPAGSGRDGGYGDSYGGSDSEDAEDGDEEDEDDEEEEEGEEEDDEDDEDYDDDYEDDSEEDEDESSEDEDDYEDEGEGDEEDSDDDSLMNDLSSRAAVLSITTAAVGVGQEPGPQSMRETELPALGVDDTRIDAGCIICCTDIADTVLLPCKHLALCRSCCDKIELTERDSLEPRTMVCPICRATVLDRITIFRS